MIHRYGLLVVMLKYYTDSPESIDLFVLFAPFPHDLYTVSDGRNPFSRANFFKASKIRFNFDKLLTVTLSKQAIRLNRQSSTCLTVIRSILMSRSIGLIYPFSSKSTVS